MIKADVYEYQISTAPASDPTLLFILSAKNIYKIILPNERNSSSSENFEPAPLTSVLKLKAPIGMEIDYFNRSVCVLENFEIFCYNASDFLQKWKMPSPDFLPSPESECLIDEHRVSSYFDESLITPTARPNIMISQFSLDWMSRNWYFMDLLNNFVFICNSEMKFCHIIIRSVKSDTVKFRSFAIDPNAGYLFLTKHDPKSRMGAALLRYSMDGTNMKSLLQDKLFYINDLTLDVAMKKIYFLDHYFDFIQQCDYDGGNRQFLQKLPPMKFHRIAFFENMFYGAVSKNLSVVQISKSSSIPGRSLAVNLMSPPKMVKVFHQQVQPMSTRVKICSTNSKCEHLCVPMLETNESKQARVVEKCMCQEGFKLENGKCKMRDVRKLLMYVQDYPKVLKAVEVSGSDEQMIVPVVGLRSNIAFDVDMANKILYFSSFSDLNSSDSQIIEYQSFNGSARRMLKGDFGAIQSMVYDWVGKNLYFTSQSPKPKIALVKLNGNEDDPAMIKTLVYRNIIGPCSLALDPEKGKSN
jgi:hypothetical protein